jgi:hypothetical protein
VVEQDGVRVAVAVQVTLPKQAPCDCSHELPPGRRDDGGDMLGDALLGTATTLKLAARWAFLGTGRALLLALNVVGLLGAQFARGYLLGWAHLGGTHRQLSRSISPWLSEGKTPLEIPYLVAEVLERPKSVPPPIPKRLKAAEALAIERKRLTP